MAGRVCAPSAGDENDEHGRRTQRRRSRGSSPLHDLPTGRSAPRRPDLQHVTVEVQTSPVWIFRATRRLVRDVSARSVGRSTRCFRLCGRSSARPLGQVPLGKCLSRWAARPEHVLGQTALAPTLSQIVPALVLIHPHVTLGPCTPLGAQSLQLSTWTATGNRLGMLPISDTCDHVKKPARASKTRQARRGTHQRSARHGHPPWPLKGTRGVCKRQGEPVDEVEENEYP